MSRVCKRLQTTNSWLILKAIRDDVSIKMRITWLLLPLDRESLGWHLAPSDICLGHSVEATALRRQLCTAGTGTPLYPAERPVDQKLAIERLNSTACSRRPPSFYHGSCRSKRCIGRAYSESLCKGGILFGRAWVCTYRQRPRVCHCGVVALWVRGRDMCRYREA
jgi:hypothetical protein